MQIMYYNDRKENQLGSAKSRVPLPPRDQHAPLVPSGRLNPFGDCAVGARLAFGNFSTEKVPRPAFYGKLPKFTLQRPVQ